MFSVSFMCSINNPVLPLPVHEKEKLRGRDPDKEDEEGGFGEYTRT